MEITKYIVPVVAGAMSGMILITLGETVIHHLYPMPPGVDQNDPSSLAKYVATLPASAFTFMLVNYIICSFLAGIICTLVSLRNTSRPAIVIGVVMTLAGLYYVMKIPYPRWFAIVSILVYMPSVYLGYLVVRKSPADVQN